MLKLRMRNAVCRMGLVLSVLGTTALALPSYANDGPSGDDVAKKQTTVTLTSKTSQKPSTPNKFATASRISLNSANAEILADGLKGIGPAKAQAIVAWRKANGRFTSIEQLTEVKGIGPATVDKNRSLLTL